MGVTEIFARNTFCSAAVKPRLSIAFRVSGFRVGGKLDTLVSKRPGKSTRLPRSRGHSEIRERGLDVKNRASRGYYC